MAIKDDNIATARASFIMAQRCYYDLDWRGAIMWAEDACERFTRTASKHEWQTSFALIKNAARKLEKEIAGQPWTAWKDS